MTKKDMAAKIIRVVTVPPVMVTSLIGILAWKRGDMFLNAAQAWIPILCLGIIPVLAYPCEKLLSGREKTDREKQRNMAFLFTLIGYTAAFLWALAVHVGKELMIICLIYFLSVLLLTVCNKLLHIRASGHACSVTAPLIMLIYLVDWRLVVPCLVLAVLVVWSSLYLKRHTKHDLAVGGAICILSFLCSLCFVRFLYR